MNLPNLISSLRIIMVPLFICFYMQGNIRAALAVLMLSAVSDVLDGMIARRFNMVSDLGKILDPVADKLSQAAMMFCLAGSYPQIWLLLGIHIFKELVLSAMGFFVVKSTGRVNSARWYGKACTAFIYSLMLLLLVYPRLPKELVNWLLLCCGVWMIVCLLLYFTEYLRMLHKQAGTDY